MADDLNHSLASAIGKRQRRRVAMRLQEIEGNPLRREDIEMFEMFDREGWSDEARRGHILRESKALAAE